MYQFLAAKAATETDVQNDHTFQRLFCASGFTKGMVIYVNLLKRETVVVRGGGDIATGVVQKFYRAGFNVLILETEKPTAIRRTVALCEAVYDSVSTVEDISCHKITRMEEAKACWEKGVVPLIVDPDGTSIAEIKPEAVIDAILAKRNLGTNRSMADITIALGPGFTAGEDVDAVIETKRGHDLGRMILKGQAKPNTGIPGDIAGESLRRVVYSPAAGEVKHKKQIGSIVKAGEVLFQINGTDIKPVEVRAPIDGLLRGLISDGLLISENTKAADIDPRKDINWRCISDKARCVGGAALEAYFYLKSTKENRK